VINGINRSVIASQRVGATGSRECAPDDRLPAPPDNRLREAIRSEGRLDCFVAEFIIGPAKGRTRWLLAMTAIFA
jgi:hypothetical protein